MIKSYVKDFFIAHDKHLRRYQQQDAGDEMMLAAVIMIACSIPFITIFVIEMAWAFLQEGRELPWKTVSPTH